MMRRVLAGTAAALALLVGLSVTSGYAAGLDVTTAPQASVSTETMCAPAMAAGQPVLNSATAGAATAGNHTRVAVSGIPAACQNLPMQVAIHGESGTLLRSASVAAGASGQSLEVPVARYAGNAVTDVIVRINGWIFPTNWTAPAPVNPTPPVGPVVCYQLNADGTVVTDAGGNGVRCDTAPNLTINAWVGGMQVPYEVRSSVPVLLVFNFADSAFSQYDGDRSNSRVQLNGYNGSVQPMSGYQCNELPVLRVIVHPAHGTASGAIGLYHRSGPAPGLACFSG